MKTKKLMILGAGILQLPAILKALDMGIKVVALDMDPNAVGFSVKGVEKEIISTINIPQAVEAAKRHKIDGVMTLATDMPMRTVAAIAKELNLVGITEETAVKATDKAVMRKTLGDAGVPIPRFLKIKSKEEYLQKVGAFGVPFVVKPADSSGSRGIYLIKDSDKAEEISAAYDYAVRFSKNKTVVLEEYMSGPEVSVETLTVDGVTHVIQVTDKMTTGAPHFVETGHTQPSRLKKATVERIKKVAVAANKAVGIENGPSHTEIIVTNEGPKIVEIGARLGGDCITTHLVPLSTGVDMVKCCIEIALGEKPDITAGRSNGSAIRYLSQKAGTVKSITGIKEAEKSNGVVQVSIVHGVGEEIGEIESSGSRMGFVIAQGKDADEAQKNCENAVAKIKIDIE